MHYRICIFICIVLTLLAGAVGASEDKARIVILGNAVSTYTAAPYLDVLEDPTRRLSLADVMSPDYAGKFVANQQASPGFGRTRSAYWVRFELLNQADRQWYLLLDALLGEELALTIIENGVEMPYAQKQAHYRRPLWMLQLPEGQKLTVYIRATNGGVIFNLPVEILSGEELLQRSDSDYRFHTFVYSALLILAAYNFFLFFMLREASYLTLVVHLTSLVIAMHNYNPVFESLAFFGDTGNTFFLTPLYIAIGSYSLFASQILESKRYLPKFDLGFKAIAYLCALFIPLTSMIPYGTAISSILVLFEFILILVASWFIYKKGNVVAKYFFYIFCIVFVMDVPAFLMMIFRPSEWGVHGYQSISISILILALLLSLVQAERVRLVRENMQRVTLAGEAKDSFLAAMSHELRTPLNAIFGLSTLLQLGDLDQQQRSYVKKLEDSSRYMLQLIGNILDIKKIENKSFELEHKPFVLKSVLVSIHDLLNGQATAKGLNLIFKGADDIPETLVGDRVRLSQVLLNLLTNGIKFTERGEVLLSIGKQTLPGEPKQLMLSFEITDTGIGIAHEKLSALFQPFVQLQQKTAYYQEGTGLGLAISKHLVELMGGQLYVQSTPAEGSQFRFSLAFAVHTDVAPANQDLVTKGHYQLPGTRILLVDDYELNLLVWKKLISKIGGEVVVAVDGQSTILQLQKQVFDIVLMDISLPDMNGFEVTEWIRQHSHNPNVPVIALTAHATPNIEKKCQEAGMNGYLPKPFELSELHALICRLLYTKPLS